MSGTLALIWKLDLVIEIKSAFLGVEVALKLQVPLNASFLLPEQWLWWRRA